MLGYMLIIMCNLLCVDIYDKIGSMTKYPGQNIPAKISPNQNIPVKIFHDIISQNILQKNMVQEKPNDCV